MGGVEPNVFPRSCSFREGLKVVANGSVLHIVL